MWLNDLNKNTMTAWRFLQRPDAVDIVATRIPFHIDAGTPLGASAWCSRANGAGGYRDKLLTWIPRIAHWTLTTLSYDQLPNIKATWFVDPPYNNAAGKKYATSSVNYTHLAAWCRSRTGQTVVCENSGADWLPFTTLTEQRRGIHYGSADESKAGEVVDARDGADGVVGVRRAGSRCLVRCPLLTVV